MTMSQMKKNILWINTVLWIFIFPNQLLTQSMKEESKQKIETDESVTKDMEEKLLNPSLNQYLNCLSQVFTSKRNLVYLGTGTVSSLLIWPYDEELSDDLKDDNFKEFELQAPTKLGNFFVLSGITVSIYLIGRAAKKTRLANTGLYLIEAFLTTEIITIIIKRSIQRNRPDKSNKLSFPSGHTSGVFSIASVLDARYGYKVGIPSYILAGFVGLSRIKLYKHFPTDVIAGATLGLIFGKSFAFSGRKNKSFAISPAFDVDYAGIKFGFRF